MRSNGGILAHGLNSRNRRKVTQFRLRRANAGPGDDDGAGLGWTVARGGSLRTWNGVCWTAFSGLGRGCSLGRVTKFPCPLSVGAEDQDGQRGKDELLSKLLSHGGAVLVGCLYSSRGIARTQRRIEPQLRLW